MCHAVIRHPKRVKRVQQTVKHESIRKMEDRNCLNEKRPMCLERGRGGRKEGSMRKRDHFSFFCALSFLSVGIISVGEEEREKEH